MSLRGMILLMTTFAVISDAVLIPFYPQFFAARYGETSALHAGAYVAFISIVVMATLPLWAAVAKRRDAMHLLVYTQCAAGILSLASYWAPSLPLFWVLSLAMFMCKSSYLLMYPYMMRLEDKARHAHTIGILSVLVHFGAIAGAAAGGLVMQLWSAHACIFAMAAGDFAQMFVCAWLIRRHAIPRQCRFCETDAPQDGHVGRPLRARLPIFRLACLMLAFDACVYLARPFMSLYWQRVSGSPSEVLSGLVFAIPGIVALFALRFNKRRSDAGKPLPDQVLANLALCTVGMLLQGIESSTAIIVGRVLFGWAFFQIVVKLDVTLFALSTPAFYAADFSIINISQNVGVLLASFAAGAVVDGAGLRAPFLIGGAALVLTALASVVLLDRSARSRSQVRAAAVPAAALADPTFANDPFIDTGRGAAARAK